MTTEDKPSLLARVQELNNNLQGILGNVILLLEENYLSAQDSQRAENILSCVERAAKTTEGIRQDLKQEPEYGIGAAANSPLTTETVKNTTVLVIDDEELICSFLKDTLEMAGYTALVAGTGQQGLELFEKHKDDIGCVLLDFSMPYMNGNLVLARLKVINPNTPVYIMSGYRGAQLLNQFREEGGIAGFISKPFRPDELLSAIRGTAQQIDNKRQVA